MNSNTNFPYNNQTGNPNPHYTGGYNNNYNNITHHDHEAGMNGYQYLNENNNYPQNSYQYNATNAPPGNNVYPQTGLTLADTQSQDTSTEFILPPNIKIGMICCSMICFFLFFVALLIK